MWNDAANHILDEDEEADYENDVVYEPELEGLLTDLRQLQTRLQALTSGAEDDEDDQDMRFDWDAPPPPAIIRQHHHHHHHRHGVEMFGMMGTGEPFRGKINHTVLRASPIANMSQPPVYGLTVLRGNSVRKTMELIHYYSAKAAMAPTGVREM